MARAEIFDKLDPQQAAAVRHVDGPALVVAGAGAGKTTILVRRVAHLIDSGVPPEQILLLTFTRASAKSIVERARAFTPAAAGIVGGTFHSVAARLVRENYALFGLPENFSVLDPADVLDTIRSVLDEYQTPNVLPQASTIAKMQSFAINTDRNIPDVVRERYGKYADVADEIAEISRLYVDRKKRSHALDFDDLLVFWATMAEHEATGRMLRAKFRYVMVDEHQDSNALQLRIVYGLGGAEPNVMAVGDPSQSIYGFRGAAPGTMFDFKQRWPETSIHLVETNYRSTPEIVEAAVRVDGTMAERFERRLTASRGSIGSKPNLVHVRDPASEAEWIAEAVMAARDEGTPLHEQAVLVRSSRVARQVEVALSAHNISYRFLGGVKLHEAKAVKDVMAVLRIVHNPRDETAWMRYLTLFPGVGGKKASAAYAEIMGANGIVEAIEALAKAALTKGFLARAVAPLSKASAARTPAEAMVAVKGALEPVLSELYRDEWDWRRKDVEAVVDLAGNHDTLEEFLHTVTIDVSIDKKAQSSRREMDEEAPMTVSTVHSSKGLEWDIVYLPSFIDGHMPSAHADPGDGQEEEKRLFYVAVTRAKTELRLMRPASVMMKGTPVMIGPTPYEAVLRPLLEVSHPDRAPHRSSLSLGDLRGMVLNVR